MKTYYICDLDIWIAWFDECPKIRGTGSQEQDAINDLWNRGDVLFENADVLFKDETTLFRNVSSLHGIVKSFGGSTFVRRIGEQFGVGRTVHLTIADMAGCQDPHVDFSCTDNGFAAKIVDCKGEGPTPLAAYSALNEQRKAKQDDRLLDWVIDYLCECVSTSKTEAGSQFFRAKVIEVKALKEQFNKLRQKSTVNKTE